MSDETRAGDRVLVTVDDGRVAGTVEEASTPVGSVYVKLDAPILDADLGGRRIWHVYRNPADVERIPDVPAAATEVVREGVSYSLTRRVLRPGWIPASDVREGDYVRLEASEQTRQTWREVIEIHPIDDGDPLLRWGEVYVRVRIRWVEKERVWGGIYESPYDEESWVSTILPGEKLVEVLVGPEPVR